MASHAYNPDTGELIRTDAPAAWMGATTTAPPDLDPATSGCFWRGDHWEVVVAQPDVPTPAEIKAALAMAVQRHLDVEAQAKGYDSILSAVTYADEPSEPAYQAEGRAFRKWRSAVWRYCVGALAQVQAGTRPVPTEAELIAELPALVWIV